MASTRTCKRASSSPLPERSSKKPKSSSDETSAGQKDPSSWAGFCEMESDPAFFSVILREMGVKDVTVREVFATDEVSLLEMIPQPIRGLVFLFRYREFGTEHQPEKCPEGVWFANQLPAQDSCATLAMLNILMNGESGEVDIGDHLRQFKAFTEGMTPYQRGEALASFDFVKRIHNSFAKKMDMLESDKHLSHKVKKARATKDATKKKGTKSRSRHSASEENVGSDDSNDSYESNALHYIAFVPIGNQVYKLDGMDKQPTSMGTFNTAAGETWLSVASTTITTLMTAGDDDYGIMALADSPLKTLSKSAIEPMLMWGCIRDELNKRDLNWKSFATDGDYFPSRQALGIPRFIEDTVPMQFCEDIWKETLEELLPRRAYLINKIEGIAAQRAVEIQLEAEEDEKANQRRFDYAPVIKRWFEMLAENGHLEANLDRFIASSGAGGATTKSKGKGKKK